MATHFAEKLVLTRWALAQFGVQDFTKLATMVKAPEFEGWGEDGGTKYVRELAARLPKHRQQSDDQLREYDENIVGHWKHITRLRNLHGQTLYPLYFQYLGLLMTEVYLDGYFRDQDKLVSSLNEFVDIVNRDLDKQVQIIRFNADDLNKLGFWMATGSGKTLLMHCHIRQYLHYLGKTGRRQELNRIVLLTPNEGLSRQHKDEFELSGMEAAFYDRQGGAIFAGRGVDIIDIHKLRETSGEKTVAVDTFEGNNLVLVDEGHRGSGGEEWMDKRARLCAKGFSFEYSATFGQAIKAAGTATPPKEGKPASKGYSLTQTYAKCILFDYSYKFFYDDGYGKDFNILNLAEEHEGETRPLYLTACLLGFYQQCRRFADNPSLLAPYLLEQPLMVFVGGSVTGQRQTQEDTDLVQILKFLASFIANRADAERRLGQILARQDGMVAGGQRVLERLFPYVDELYKPEQARELFTDILRYVFNAPGGGQLHIVRLLGAEGEIGLRVGENEWFGVVNVGDAKKLCDLCATGKATEEHYEVEELSFSGSLFEEIKRPASPIRLLAGAKKFTEGWSSWRVSSMGLMNVGKKEGSEIIQLFGRGVRLKGYRFKLKRSSALDVMDLEGDGSPYKHPDHIELLETLNIFGVRSDYMKEFEEYLEEEGVGEDERREVVFLPTIKLPEFDQTKIQLHVIRPKANMPEFKTSVRLKLSSLEGSLNNKVIADWYPRLEKRSSINRDSAMVEMFNQESLRNEHLAFLSWDTIWFELERHKRDKAYYNIVFSPTELRELLNSSWWYELFIPAGYLEFRGLDQRPLWQDIVIHLLKGYLERFYQFHKREFEAPYLEYQTLRSDDGLLLKQYQLLIKKSEKALISRLRELAENFKAGQFEAYSFDKLSIFQAARHLYQPLIHLSHNGGEDAIVKVVPTHLNDGEKSFVDGLEAFCKTEAKGMLADIELYLLRNHSSDKAIGFFTESGFRPDFILWLLKDGKQTIAFVDPKGLRNFTDNFNNPKIRLSQGIKKLQADLKRDDIRLESFLLSQTHRNDLRWPKPGGKSGEQATVDDYRTHHVLFATDSPLANAKELFSMLL